MINNLIPLLFGLILLAYVFSEPVIPSSIPTISKERYNQIKNEVMPPPKHPDPTLEEQIVNKMKSIPNNTPLNTPTYQPLLSNTSNGSPLE